MIGGETQRKYMEEQMAPDEASAHAKMMDSTYIIGGEPLRKYQQEQRLKKKYLEKSRENNVIEDRARNLRHIDLEEIRKCFLGPRIN